MITYTHLSFRKNLRLWATLLPFSHALLQKILQLNTCTSITPLVLNPGPASKKWIISCWILLPPNSLQFKFTPKFTLPSDTGYHNRQYTQILPLANTTPDPRTETWPISLINCNNTDQNSPQGAKAPRALQLQTHHPEGLQLLPSAGPFAAVWKTHSKGTQGEEETQQETTDTCGFDVKYSCCIGPGGWLGEEGLFGGLHTPAYLTGGDERGRGTKTGCNKARKPFGLKQTIQYFPVAWSIAIQFDFPGGGKKKKNHTDYSSSLCCPVIWGSYLWPIFQEQTWDLTAHGLQTSQLRAPLSTAVKERSHI